MRFFNILAGTLVFFFILIPNAFAFDIRYEYNNQRDQSGQVIGTAQTIINNSTNQILDVVFISGQGQVTTTTSTSGQSGPIRIEYNNQRDQSGRVIGTAQTIVDARTGQVLDVNFIDGSGNVTRTTAVAESPQNSSNPPPSAASSPSSRTSQNTPSSLSTSRQSGSLIPARIVPQCGGDDDRYGPYCQACHLMQLVQNLVNFAIFAAIAVATLMFVYAGFLYVTAASAGQDQLKKARNVFAKVFIGFVIILVAWLIIDLIMKTFLGDEQRENYGPWNEIKCVEFRRVPAPSSSGGIGTQVTQRTLSCNSASSGACSPSALSGTFGARASDASVVCLGESGGRPNVLSDSDRMSNDPGNRAFSVGLFQINMTVHDLPAACGANLNCTQAFEGRNYSARVVNDDLYNRCVAALQTVSCNLATARRIYDGRGGRFVPDWSVAQTCRHRLAGG